MRILISVNTCNTDNFGLYIPNKNDANLAKSYCLLANAYPKKKWVYKKNIHFGVRE